MAILENSATGKRVILRPRHLVGRSRLAHLQLAELNVSGEHAALVWSGSRWELHDLGSKNGTYLNNYKLDRGARIPLDPGALLGFASADGGWQLIDDSPPSAMVVTDDRPEPLVVQGDILALPDESNPQVMLFRDRSGEWCLDRDGETTRAVDGQQITVADRQHTLILPERLASTWAGASVPLSIDCIKLTFGVSQDEEFVQLRAAHGEQQIDFGARSHNYLLLTLARARLQEQQEVTTPSAAGWRYVDDLAKKLCMDETHLNVSIYRCRQQLGKAGILGAAGIIERRKPTRQIRLGVENVEIEQI